MPDNHYDNVVSQVKDELWTYAETTSSNGARLLKVFFYDDNGDGRCYVELTENSSGLLDSNADYREYLIGSSEEMPTNNLDANEALDLLYAAYDDMFPGYFACEEPGYSGWLVNGIDYSYEDETATDSDWYWRDDIVEIRDRYDMEEWEKDEVYYEAGRRIALSNGEYEEGTPEFEDAAIEESSNIINLFSISYDTKLYRLLPRWYDYLWNEDPEWGKHHHASELYAEMEDNIRDCFYLNGSLWFVTGTGYSIMSDDLLGGRADGRAERAFDEWSSKQQ